MSGDLISIERELVRLGTNLDDLTQEFEGLCRRAGDTKTDYEVASAKALLYETNKKDTVKVRDSEALLICEHELRESRIADAIMKAAKARIDSLQSLLTVHQSRLRWLDEGTRVGTERKW